MVSMQVKGYLAYDDALEIANKAAPNFDIKKVLEKRKNEQILAMQHKTCKISIPNTANMAHCSSEKVPFGFIGHGHEVEVLCKAGQYTPTNKFTCGKVQPSKLDD